MPIPEVRATRPGQVAIGWGGALELPSYAVVDAPAGPEPPDARVDPDAIWVDGPVPLLLSLETHADGWSLRVRYPEGCGVHGLGGRTRWDLRGHTYRCWNTDPGGAWEVGRDPLYNTTPAFLVLGDTGAAHVFIDNPWDASVTVGRRQVVARFTGGPARCYVSVGTLPQVVDAFTALTGRPAVPPRWALGHHQARWGYASAAEVRDVWRGFAEHGLPLSAMHLDIDHMDRFRNFTFGESYADAPALIGEMAADGVRTVVIVDAGTARADDYSVYADGLQRGVFCRNADGSLYVGKVWPGPTVFPDYTDPAARRWWGEQFGFYLDRGVAGFWHDMNEPVVFDEASVGTFPLDTRHDLDGAPGDHRAAHNVFGFQMMRASYEGLIRLRPQQRPMLFSRSGWAGLQRYGGHWSGDIETAWEGLLATIHQAFGLGAQGIGYYGPDIGGFTGQPSPELFTRWFQLGSFLPFFRTHCAFTAPRREPWEWGPQVLQLLRQALLRRYRLLPYWYTLAHAASRDGAPYIRPLAWVDPALRGVADEFLVGEDVLVAPVLREGATSRRVLLPAGVWWHGDTGERYEGEFEMPVGPGDTPWFVRAGAVLPTEEQGSLVLLVAPPEPGGAAPGGRLITDSGDGWAPVHEERYHLVGDSEVRREVVAQGDFGYTSVVARRLDGAEVHVVA